MDNCVSKSSHLPTSCLEQVDLELSDEEEDWGRCRFSGGPGPADSDSEEYESDST